MPRVATTAGLVESDYLASVAVVVVSPITRTSVYPSALAVRVKRSCSSCAKSIVFFVPE